MGLTRRRALLAVATALVLVATTACTDGGEDPSSDGTTTTADDEPAPDGSGTGEGIGGSRYLALIRRAGESFEIVVEDLVEGGETVVRRSDEPFAGVAVSADGLVAWEQTIGDAVRVSLAYDADQDPIEVAALSDVGCPAWRDSTSLLVASGHDPTRIALVDPTTGALQELPVVLDSDGCAAPAGPDHVVFARPLGGEPFGPEGAEVVRAAIDGSGEAVVGHIPPECWANNVSASFDGARLAAEVLCEGDEAHGSALYVGSMDDDLAPLVAENPPEADIASAYQYWSPSWSADGTVIAYHRFDPADGDGTSHVWTVPSAGGEPEPHGSERQSSPSFSPPLGGGRD